MLPKPSEGAVVLIDRMDGRGPHRWIVLTDPDDFGEFAIASWSDAEKHPSRPSTWPKGTRLTSAYRLTKDSAIPVRFVAVRDEAWLDNSGASFIGMALPAALARAKCDVATAADQLQPEPASYLSAAVGAWMEEC